MDDRLVSTIAFTCTLVMREALNEERPLRYVIAARVTAYEFCELIPFHCLDLA
jgi:hypothetical protein